jgi:transposase-like protein
MGAWSICGAVDAKGEVLDVLVQSKRDKRAALKLMRKLLRKYAVVPDACGMISRPAAKHPSDTSGHLEQNLGFKCGD